MRQLLSAFEVLEADVGGLGEAGAEIVRGDRLWGADAKPNFTVLDREVAARTIPGLLVDIQQGLFTEARDRREANIVRGIDSIAALDAHFSADKRYPGWAEVQWSRPDGEALDKVVELLKARKLTFRNVPLDAEPADGACPFTGEPAVERIYVARAY